MAELSPLVDVRKLTLSIPEGKRLRPLLADIDLTLQPGVRVGLLGGSGSGKSTLCRALMGILPARAVWTASRFELFGATHPPNVRPDRRWRSLLGSKMALVMQDARNALNPLMRIGDQIGEPLWPVLGRRTLETRTRVLDLLRSVEIEDPERVFALYPHEVSGGMGQRIMIAMMLAQGPQLILADEPTSALDAPIKREVLKLLDRQIERYRAALLFVSHDIDVLCAYCDEVLVMDGGRIVDRAPAVQIRSSVHPYTQRLVQAIPRLEQRHD